MGTKHQLLLLLRKRPGITVTEAAGELGLSGMAVRRHLAGLAAGGLVERAACTGLRPGRPPTGWRLTDAGMEVFPRHYDALVLDLLEDFGAEEVAAVLGRRTDKQVAEYREALAGCVQLNDRVAELSRLRDQAGYLAEWSEGDGAALVLTENNCAVHHVAERHPVVCAMELSLIRRVMGPEVNVSRVAHAMAGDAVCSYCIAPRDQPAPGPEPGAR